MGNGDDLSIDDIMNHNKEADNKAYVLEVDLEYPNELHDLHNDYPLAREKNQPKGDNCYKLCGKFHDERIILFILKSYYYIKNLI